MHNLSFSYCNQRFRFRPSVANENAVIFSFIPFAIHTAA